nr:reverse transcriptase domain-containing protein [Tanacetum cinerariifolium]
MYLAAANEAISAVLTTERDVKQMHIYFVSRALQGLKVNYTLMEKLILALRFELEEHDSHYRPRTLVKGQILADFIVEHPKDDPIDTPIDDKEELPNPWCFASVKHPQANGLVERENRSLGEGIKARLDERSKNWLEQISHVLWAHYTMNTSSNGETPFSLTYGAEAVIPIEIGMPTLRTTKVDMIKNDEALGVNLDTLEEKKEQAVIQEAKSKSKMEKYYNARVRSTSFRLRDLVYQNNKASHAEDGGKLGPKWEGPYEVTEALGKGAYKLRDRNINTLPRT